MAVTHVVACGHVWAESLYIWGLSLNLIESDNRVFYRTGQLESLFGGAIQCCMVRDCPSPRMSVDVLGR